MKKYAFKSFLLTALTIAALQFPACKGKTQSDAGTTDTAVTDTTAAAPAPVTISPDEELTKNVKDATKDFPGVNATVDSGVVTLTGNISRERLQKLMMSLNALHPKKISNQLTISK